MFSLLQRWMIPAALGLRVLVALPMGAAEPSPSEAFEKTIRPLLEKTCLPCHGPEKQKGDLNLADFKDYGSITNHLEVWAGILERVSAFEMPPKKAPQQLSFDQQGKLVAFLRALPKTAPTDCTQLASDRTANFYKGYVMSRRLNREEYLNTLRDLFGVPVPVEDLIPADGGGGEGFDTTGSALFLSSIHIERYLEAADRALLHILPERTAGLTPERKAARDRILLSEPAGRSDARRAARAVVGPFAERAWRRPVETAEVDRLMLLFDRGHERRDGFLPSLRLALKGVLISPHFLFLAEPEPAEGGIQPLGTLPLASKLSYFLWSSMPDDRLMDLARTGRLSDPAVYLGEVRRMLADPRADALGERFAIQWLDLDRLGTDVKPDPSRYPEFDARMKHDMKAEVIALASHIFRGDRPLLEFLTADYSFLNQRLAALYGVEGVSGDALRQVRFESPRRGGVLGMAAVHAVTSYPLRTSPVLRGRWVLEVLLGEKVPPPPPDVPPLDEKGQAAAPMTLRKQLEVHRVKAECAACHDKMDPLGFGMENFDVLGRWRDTDHGQPIDSTGTLPSGKVFQGPEGLKGLLTERRDAVMRHLCRKMTGFAFGRELNKFDDCVIDSAMSALKEREYRASALVEAIANSFAFRNRFYPRQQAE